MGIVSYVILISVMLITLGLDSQFTMTETIITVITDQFPNLRNHKGKVVFGVSLVGFILGLTFCTRGGIFMFDLINSYCASWGLLICAIVEILVVMYAYGEISKLTTLTRCILLCSVM